MIEKITKCKTCGKEYAEKIEAIIVCNRERLGLSFDEANELLKKRLLEASYNYEYLAECNALMAGKHKHVGNTIVFPKPEELLT